MTDQVVTLQEQLSEKEQLVAALTDRLEQAAEQLDRRKRTGANRGVDGVGSFPSELIEDHKNLVGELQHAVEQWEDMQVAASLGRVEIQISELRDLISGQLADGKFVVAPQQHATAATGMQQDALQEETPEAHEQTDSVEDDEKSDWESMKAGILAENSEASSELDEQEVAQGETDLSAETTAADLNAVPFSEVAAPAAIDFTTADTEQLVQAVEDRDSYIAHLLKQLRVAQSVIKPPTDWESLNNAPDELCQRIEDLEKQLDDNLRVAEVELSLERARLGREAVKLQQLEEQVQKNMKLLGLDPENGDPAQTQGTSADSGGKRWLGMLGLGNGD